MSKKAIALLELTIGSTSANQKFYSSLSYFWTKTPIFERFPVIDVATGQGNTIEEKTINLLDKYYQEGYRIFVGFMRSSIVDAVIEWFNQHPDAIGMSPTSTSDSLNFPKSIYRLVPTDQTLINSINTQLQTAIDNGGKIYYVYSKDELATLSLLEYMNTKYGAENIKLFPVEVDSSNLTVENLQTFYQDSSAVDVAVVYLFVENQQQKYISLFNNVDGLDIPLKQYSLDYNLVEINPNTTTLKNKYSIILPKSVTTSSLWNSALEYMGDNFNTPSLNLLYLATALIRNLNILNIYSYNGVLQFNENKDIEYYSYGLYLYTDKDVFFNNIISVKDPLYGDLIFNAIE